MVKMFGDSTIRCELMTTKEQRIEVLQNEIEVLKNRLERRKKELEELTL